MSAEGWWLHPQRLLQTNLRETDADLDPERYVADALALGASAVLLNVGGIAANYPTALACQRRNPHLRGDLVGELCTRLHAAGLRVIGRFDFSKVDAALAEEHPEWLYRDAAGRTVAFGDLVHTCFLGAYQQERSLEMIAEALAAHPLDGVFINMPGHPERDYHGQEHGPCHAGPCRQAFRAGWGMDPPAGQPPGDPIWAAHAAFKHATEAAFYQRLAGCIASVRPGTILMNYRLAGAAVVRSEANRPVQEWAHEEAAQALRSRLRHPALPASRSAMHFPEMPWRHMGVAPALTARRLQQAMLHGQWLDFTCLGPIERLEDRLVLPAVAEAFRFHAAHAGCFAGLEPVADLGLVDGGGEPFRGVFTLLAEAHLGCVLVDRRGAELGGLRVLVVGDGADLPAEACARLDAWVEAGGRLLLLGDAPEGLACAPVQGPLRLRPPEKGRYLRVRPADAERLGQPELRDLGLLLLDGPFRERDPAPGAEGLLRLIPDSVFAPPERARPGPETGVPGLLLRRHGAGACALLPWDLGGLAVRRPHPAWGALLRGVLCGLLGVEPGVEIASPLVQVSRLRSRDGRFEWVGLLNLAGAKDQGLHPPPPQHDLRLLLRPGVPAPRFRLLHAGLVPAVERSADGRCAVHLPRLDAFEILLAEAG